MVKHTIIIIFAQWLFEYTYVNVRGAMNCEVTNSRTLKSFVNIERAIIPKLTGFVLFSGR